MTILGIDLGTTNSACGIWRNGKVELIPNRLGDTLTPSVVGLDDNGELIVGRTAKERLIHHSNLTVAAFKRTMGTHHKIRLGNQSFSSTELSALVLRSLKEDAEARLGETITEAVISVPAYFNDNQRQATKLAGEMAGLKVERLINEPTAAAIAYGLHERKEGTFLILDMGGGTFDVSILEFFEGVMEVHASAGDNFLGGEDFVEAMAEQAIRELKIDKSTLTPSALQTLYMQLETIKRRINQTATHTVSFKNNDTPYELAITNDWFQKTITPLLLRAKRPIETAMRDAQLPASDIDDVVLVGGSTRLSAFRSTVGKMFGRLPSCHLDPDTVVAMGAAIQAGLKSKDAALDDMVLTDVCPYTLGTNIVNEESPEQGAYFYPIIERNTVVPASIVKRLYTAADNQSQISVGIYQGENRYVDKNVPLGEVVIDVPKGPAGKESVDVRYSYDMNGLLDVDVTVVSTQKKANKVIEHSPGAISPEEKRKSLEKLATLKFHPREDEVNRALLARGERLYESSLGDKREEVARLLRIFDSILEAQNAAEIKKAQSQLKDAFDRLDEEEWF